MKSLSESPKQKKSFEYAPFVSFTINSICIVVVAALLVSFNGGIGVNSSNHVGLVPVVRRILDPNYLPGDFNISLRLYHHRIFAYLLAGLSTLMGEERGIVLLHLAGALLMAVSLWYLCRTLGFSLWAYLTACLFLATGFLWTGLGLEENVFIGNIEVQPPLFAHSFVLLAAACILRERYRLAAFFAAMSLLFHLQIGVICTLMIAPFYAVRLKKFSIQEYAKIVLIYLLPALPALFNLSALMRSGLLRPKSTEYTLPYYIDFRHPHHFEVMSATHGLWVAGHLIFQLACWYWLKRMKRDEARFAGGLAAMSLTLAALALIHFTDYYIIKHDRIANIQMIRLSPLITVFGTLSLMLFINVLAQQWANRTGRAWVPGAVTVAALALGVGLGEHHVLKKDSEFYFGIKRYSDRKNSWVAMCNWIKANGPRDSVYLTPPAYDGFTALTGLSNVVEFKINPDGALYMDEWFERLKDMTGGKLANGRGFQNRRPLNNAYGDLTAEQFEELGKKYGARYAVVPKGSKIDFTTLHENSGFKLVKLP